MNFFYADDFNQVLGPFGREELFALRQRGQIIDETPVIEEGAAEWRTCADFLPRPTSPAPPPPLTRQATPLAARRLPSAEGARFSRRPVKTLALVAGVVLAVVLSMVVRGQTGKPGKHGNSEPTSSDPANIEIPATWKFVAYEGKHLSYRLFVPDFWTAMTQPPDESADRAFAGPHGLVLSLYELDDVAAFEAGLRKSMPDARVSSIGTNWFIDSTPVNGVRLGREMFLFQFGQTTLAVTLRAPVDTPVALIRGFAADAGLSMGYSKAAFGKPDRPDAFDVRPRTHSMLLTELGKWDEIDRTTKAVVSRPHTIGKEQYKTRLSFYFGWSVGDRLIADADWFQHVMGRPVRTQTMQMGRDTSTLWYYECADGTIQLAADARALANNGVIRATLNDY